MKHTKLLHFKAAKQFSSLPFSQKGGVFAYGDRVGDIVVGATHAFQRIVVLAELVKTEKLILHR